MTTTADGTRCDRCGADLGNGSVAEAVTLSALAVLEERQEVRNLHLGLAHRCGCAGRVLTRAALAHYVEAVDEPGKVLPLYVAPAPVVEEPPAKPRATRKSVKAPARRSRAGRT